ncbi:MAG: VWA domain-containing protein [Candidatus Sumerlaeaceae bacterium]|nr:VWA domain-containing protein [Candidatus Sumerlaeaceae bacterium]
MIQNVISFLQQTTRGDSSGDHFRFAASWALLLVLAVILLVFLAHWIYRHKASALSHSNTELVIRARPVAAKNWFLLWRALRGVALLLLVIALARPQYGRVERRSFTEGIDIMLVLDVSGSMRSQDFTPNRLEAAKEVIKDFVAGRRGDRIGLVIFGASAATLVPLTLDYVVVQQFVDRVTFGLVDERATAIGLGIATALKKLEASKAKSKVIVLLTDGENNAGNIDPLAAANAAKALKVRIYTIGVGTDVRQSAAAFFGGMLGPEAGLDEETLKAIADRTGGLYFHATNNEKLRAIYHQIDKLEKTRIQSTQFDRFDELAPYLIAAALVLLGFELLLTTVRVVKIP